MQAEHIIYSLVNKIRYMYLQIVIFLLLMVANSALVTRFQTVKLKKQVCSWL